MSIQPLLSPSTSSASARFERSNRSLTVHLVGELDVASAPVVANAVQDEVQSDDESLLVDLSGLSFCDSSGLMLFFRLNQRATDAGTDFALCHPTPAVLRILDVCDPSRVLTIRT